MVYTDRRVRLFLTYMNRRQAAIDLPEPIFMGWRDFLHKLNSFINKYVRNIDDDLDFVTFSNSVDDNPDRNRVVLHVYLKESSLSQHDPQKLLSAVKYFIGEMGLRITDQTVDPEDQTSVLLTITGLKTYNYPKHYQNIKNQWLKKALLTGQVIDVRQVGVEIEPGLFRLNSYIPNVKYVDSENEDHTIWSIGKDKSTGEIFAAYDTRFYLDDDFECLYLL